MSNCINRFLIFIVSFLLGCQTNSSLGYKTRNTDEFYQSTGGIDFVLAEVPRWANVVTDAGCFRNSNLRVLDLQKIKNEFNTTYRESLAIQYFYNQTLDKIRSRLGVIGTNLTLKDYDLSFFNALEVSKASVDPLRLPDFNKIHLIIYEEWSKNGESDQMLMEFLRSSIHNAGVPVIVSFCTPQNILESKFQEFGAYSVGAEWVAPYGEDFQPKTSWGLVLNAFIKPHQSVVVYRSKNSIKMDYSRLLLGKYLIK